MKKIIIGSIILGSGLGVLCFWAHQRSKEMDELNKRTEELNKLAEQAVKETDELNAQIEKKKADLMDRHKDLFQLLEDGTKRQA